MFYTPTVCFGRSLRGRSAIGADRSRVGRSSWGRIPTVYFGWCRGCLESLLAAFWAPFGLAWAPFGPFCAPLGLFWAPPGLSWAPLELSWSLLGRLGAVKRPLEASKTPHDASETPLGPPQDLPNE